MNRELLKVNGLKVYYKGKRKNIFDEATPVKAVDGISFTVNSGESLGIVGESGCGKTSAALALTGLAPITSGEILLDNRPIGEGSKSEISKKIQIIFQDSYLSLDPRYTVGKTIEEPLVIHKWASADKRKERVLGLMEEVGLRKEYYNRLPHEFSGGQRQRVNIARALALNPSIIVCDEPVSALDVSIQAQILNLMKRLQKQYGLAYVFISHNLSVVRFLCERIAVMYLGHIVEIAGRDEFFNNTLHPYSKILLNSVPSPNPKLKKTGEVLTVDTIDYLNPEKGCVFHTRCAFANEICKSARPELKSYGTGHEAACHRIGEFG